MNSSRLRSLLPALVLTAVFSWSLWQVATTRRAVVAPGKTVLRVGHWLLHAGMRESFAQAISDYEKLHPDVTVVQLPVPIRTYSSWLRTRLIGANAPDLTGMLTVNEEVAGRHFLALDAYLNQPNPYNAGTPLEGVPWRDTFVDGLDAVRGLFAPVSGEIYGVNLQINTLRLYFNRKLLRAVTGSDSPPATFAELQALGGRVADYNARTGARLVPIASCGPYATFLFNTLVPSQTQRLLVESNPARNLTFSQHELAAAFLKGELSYSTPALRSGLELMRDVTALMTPGFDQLQRDDALFAYLQQQAVMLYAGSWDYGVLVRDGPFPTGLVTLPLPGPEHPGYGRFVLGPASESAGSPEATFGIARTSPHPELALDFLQFLSSRTVAENFSRQSHRIASIVGTPPPPDAPGLAPVLGGEVGGFLLDFTGFGGGNTLNLFRRNLHLALGPKGDADNFIKALEARLPETLRQDMEQHLDSQQRMICRLDAQLAFELTRPPAAAGSDPSEEWLVLAEAQSLRQHGYLPLRKEMP